MGAFLQGANQGYSEHQHLLLQREHTRAVADLLKQQGKHLESQIRIQETDQAIKEHHLKTLLAQPGVFEQLFGQPPAETSPGVPPLQAMGQPVPAEFGAPAPALGEAPAAPSRLDVSRPSTIQQQPQAAQYLSPDRFAQLRALGRAGDPGTAIQQYLAALGEKPTEHVLSPGQSLVATRAGQQVGEPISGGPPIPGVHQVTDAQGNTQFVGVTPSTGAVTPMGAPIPGIKSKWANVHDDPLNPGQSLGINIATGRMEQIPSDVRRGGGGGAGGGLADLHGENFLKTIPQNVGSQVKALSEGRLQFPAGFALKSPYWQNMLSMTSQYDPSFDAINYNARSQTRKDFTSGKSAQSLNALNTVMGHLDNFDKSMTALNNSGAYVFNWLRNVSKAPFNPDLKAKLNAFNIDKQAVVSEFERAYRGTGGNVTDLNEWKKSFDAADSPQAMKASVKEGLNLLESKIEALGDTYNKGMGTAKDGLELLSPKARATFNKLAGRPQEQPVMTEPSGMPAGLTTKQKELWMRTYLSRQPVGAAP